MSVLDEIAAEVAADPESLGLILHGSRAAGVHEPESDYDLVRVVTDASYTSRRERGELREKRSGSGPAADVVYSCPERFRLHAQSPDGYTGMFATAEVVVDKDGQVAALVRAINEEGGRLNHDNLAELYDGYLNCFVRSLKAWRRGDELGGRMQAAESCLYLVRVLFALEERWPPYHDQLHGPLLELERTQSWSDGFLEKSLVRVLATGDPSFQQELELQIEALMDSRGIAHEWGPEDDLEPLKAHRFEVLSA
jgi:predicted nucleotidyltransferase